MLNDKNQRHESLHILQKETPLHLAVRYGHSPSVALLIENGASLAAVDNIVNHFSFYHFTVIRLCFYTDAYVGWYFNDNIHLRGKQY